MSVWPLSGWPGAVGRWVWADAALALALALSLALTLAAAATLVADTTPGLLDFSVDERQRIAQHGPWPPPKAPDPGNALAGKPAAIALGQRLFFEPRLSADGRFACASCHRPDRAFSDGLPRAVGRDLGRDRDTGMRIGATLDRNTPTLWDADQQRWYGWGGAFDSLWSQALHPLLSSREMAATPAQLRQLLRDDTELACRWRQLRGSAAVPADDDALTVALAKPLGAFVGTLRSGRSAFDHFRDALQRGDSRAAVRYPLAAQRGLRLFIGRGQCSSCHSGPLFSNGEFGDIGALFFVRPGVVDAGRHAGIQALQASRFNLLGGFSDGANDEAVRKTRHVLLQHRNFGEFKVPSLRQVAHTAPYLHDGQLATLEAVVEHYATLSPDRLHADGAMILKPLQLSPGERADLLAFLRSLSSPRDRVWQAPALPPCTGSATAMR